MRVRFSTETRPSPLRSKIAFCSFRHLASDRFSLSHLAVWEEPRFSSPPAQPEIADIALSSLFFDRASTPFCRQSLGFLSRVGFVFGVFRRGKFSSSHERMLSFDCPGRRCVRVRTFSFMEFVIQPAVLKRCDNSSEASYLSLCPVVPRSPLREGRSEYFPVCTPPSFQASKMNGFPVSSASRHNYLAVFPPAARTLAALISLLILFLLRLLPLSGTLFLARD